MSSQVQGSAAPLTKSVHSLHDHVKVQSILMGIKTMLAQQVTDTCQHRHSWATYWLESSDLRNILNKSYLLFGTNYLQLLEGPNFPCKCKLKNNLHTHC